MAKDNKPNMKETEKPRPDNRKVDMDEDFDEGRQEMAGTTQTYKNQGEAVRNREESGRSAGQDASRDINRAGGRDTGSKDPTREGRSGDRPERRPAEGKRQLAR